jgi:uncharacterized protein YbaP (TraB family)
MGASARGRVTRLIAALAAWLAAATAAADPPAWRIAGRNGGEVALLGSMHVLRSSDYPLPALVDELFARADVVVMEMDLDDLEPAAMQSALLTAALLPPNETLESVLEADVYDEAARRASAMGLDIALLARLEPWLVAITMLDLGLRKIGFEAERGLEQYLVSKAAAAHKDIVGLETIGQQVRIFDELSAHDQEALLEQTLDELENGGTLMGALAEAWRGGELETLTDELLGDFDDFPELYESLVVRRNAEWTDELDRLLGDGRRYLVVVGALHLVGRDSVVQRLEARGHRVVRLGAN